ncbi:MAG: RNA polymerase sigma factor [Candidatus Baltobacteraceae bacterium]|jgi:RNA polymerase sigma-70 factor (ECF subfamily)
MSASERAGREVAEALARDLDAHFEKLVTTYEHRVFGFALNLVGDRPAAEELAQETFVAAYRALCGYGPERRRELSPRAWLYAIVLNRVRNRARSPARRTLSLDERCGASLAADPREQPAAVVERRESAEALRAALGRLALKYRAPVVLRHVDGRSYAEIAAMLGRPAGTIKAEVHRGLAQLRKELRRSEA